ncbi:hypothetical protein AGMMS49992_08880 [Clostridia bacterium]|nr:hypothetical protein AGMMS49992_08880 [Clostridia bacterium]
MELISARDHQIIRDLAKKQTEFAHSEKMRALYHEWKHVGSFDSSARPMVTVELWTFANELLPQRLRCESEEARKIEGMLLFNIMNHEQFDDDTVVRDHIGIPIQCNFQPFGLEPIVEHAGHNQDGLGFHFIPLLNDLEEDFHLLGPSRFSIDREASLRSVDELSELFGDILPVRLENNAQGASPMQNVIRLMGMENMYTAMIDAPDRFHQMLSMLTDDYCAFFKLMESENILMPLTYDQHLNQGTYCFTDDLPAQKDRFTLSDQWLYLDSQETAGISPAMYSEFVTPNYKKVSDMFGLLSYGCCESVHAIWKDGVDQYKNLRKLSISPWCDERVMGDILRGKKIVYLRKPTPNLLGVGTTLDEDAVRAHLKETAIASRGCLLEISQRDVYKIGQGSEKVRRYVQLIRETISEYWHP